MCSILRSYNVHSGVHPCGAGARYGCEFQRCFTLRGLAKPRLLLNLSVNLSTAPQPPPFTTMKIFPLLLLLTAAISAKLHANIQSPAVHEPRKSVDTRCLVDGMSALFPACMQFRQEHGQWPKSSASLKQWEEAHGKSVVNWEKAAGLELHARPDGKLIVFQRDATGRPSFGQILTYSDEAGVRVMLTKDAWQYVRDLSMADARR